MNLLDLIKSVIVIAVIAVAIREGMGLIEIMILFLLGIAVMNL